MENQEENQANNSCCNSFIKIIAAALFITLPFVGFYLGMQYQSLVIPSQDQTFINILKPKNTTNLTNNTPTASQAADINNWKTYKNTKYGYSFKYPANKMEIASSSDPNVIYIQTIGFDTQHSQEKGFYQIQVTALQNKVQTIDEYINLKVKSDGPPEKNFIENQLETTINGYPAVVTTYKPPIDGSKYSGFSNHKKYYLYSRALGMIFQGNGPIAVKSTDHTILDQILSTFRFE